MPAIMNRIVPNYYEYNRERLAKNSKLYDEESWKRIATGNANSATLDSYIYALDKMPNDDNELQKFKDDYMYDYAKEPDRLLSIFNEVYADKDTLYKRNMFKRDAEGNYLKKGNEKEDGTFEEIPISREEAGVLNENELIQEEKMLSDYDYYKEMLKLKNSQGYRDYLLQTEENIKNSRSFWTKLGNDITATAGEFFVNGVVKQLNNIAGEAAGIYKYFETLAKTNGDNDKASDEFVKMTKSIVENDKVAKFQKMFLDWELKHSSFRDITTGDYTTAGKWIGGVSNTLGQMVPSVLVSLAGSGIGGAVGKSGSAVGKIAKKVIGITTEAISSGLFYSGFAAEQLVESYNILSQRGISISNAALLRNVHLKMALQYAIEFGLDRILGSTALDKMAFGRATKGVSFGNLTANSFMRLLKDAWQEGTEEVLQDLSDYLVDRIYAVAVNENFGELSQFNGQTMMDSFFMGALTSIVGSMGRVAITRRLKTDKVKYEKDGVTPKEYTKGKKQGIYKTTYLNKFASWEYGLSIREFFEKGQKILAEYNKITKSNNILKNLSKTENEDFTKYRKQLEKQLLGFYEAYRVLTDFCQSIGEQRLLDANALLEKIQNAPSINTVGEIINKDINEMFSNVKLLDIYQTNSPAGLLTRKALLINKLKEHELTKQIEAYDRNEKVDIDNGEKVAKELASALNVNEQQTAKKILEDNKDIKGVVVTEKGSMVYDEEDKVLYIGKSNLGMDESGNLVYDGIAESLLFSTFISKITEGKFKGLVLDKLNDIYEKYEGNKAPNTESVIAKFMFDGNFMQAVLLEANIDIYQFVSSFKDFADTIIKDKTDESKNIKKKVNQVIDTLRLALREYCILQPNAPTNISLFTTSDLDYIKQNRNNVLILSRLMNNTLTDADLLVLKKQIRIINDMTFDEKSALFNSLQSKDVIDRYNAMVTLTTHLETSFYNEYDGKTYMPLTSIPNRVFNNYLYDTGLTIKTIDKPANDDELKMIGSTDSAACIQYHRLMFEKSTNGMYTFNINEDNITVYEKKTMTAVGFANQYNSILNVASSRDIDSSSIVVNTVVQTFKSFLNNKLDSVTKAYLTIDDVITDATYLNDAIRSGILRDYGIINPMSTALYLRKELLQKTDKKVSIVMKSDGTYTFASVEDMDVVLKNKNIKKKDLYDGMLLSEIFNEKYLDNNTRNSKIIFTREPIVAEYRKLSKNKDGKWVFDNNIYVNLDRLSDDDLAFVLVHELQHAIQNQNMLNLGINNDWIDGLPEKQRNALVKDVVAHMPDLFKSYNTSMSNSNPDKKAVINIVSDYVYFASGETQAYGLEGANITTFNPVLVRQNIPGTISIVMPWGKSYVFGGFDKMVSSFDFIRSNDKKLEGFIRQVKNNEIENSVKITIPNGKENFKYTLNTQTNTYRDFYYETYENDNYIKAVCEYFGIDYNSINSNTLLPVYKVDVANQNKFNKYTNYKKVDIYDRTVYPLKDRQGEFIFGIPQGILFDTYIANVFNNNKLYSDNGYVIRFGFITYDKYMSQYSMGRKQIDDMSSNMNKSIKFYRDRAGNFVPVKQFKYFTYDFINDENNLIMQKGQRQLNMMEQQMADLKVLKENSPIDKERYKAELDERIAKNLFNQTYDLYKYNTWNNDYTKVVLDFLKTGYEMKANVHYNQIIDYKKEINDWYKNIADDIVGIKRHALSKLLDITLKLEKFYDKYILKDNYTDGRDFYVNYINDLLTLQSDIKNDTKLAYSFTDIFTDIKEKSKYLQYIQYFRTSCIPTRDVPYKKGTITLINSQYYTKDMYVLNELFERHGIHIHFAQNLMEGVAGFYSAVYRESYDKDVERDIYAKVIYGDKRDKILFNILNVFGPIKYNSYTPYTIAVHELIHALISMANGRLFNDILPPVLQTLNELKDLIVRNEDTDTIKFALAYIKKFKGYDSKLKKDKDGKKGKYNVLEEVITFLASKEIVFDTDYYMNNKKSKNINKDNIELINEINEKIELIWNQLQLFDLQSFTTFGNKNDNIDIDKLFGSSIRQKKYDVKPEHLEFAKQKVKDYTEKTGIKVNRVVEEPPRPGTAYLYRLVAYTDNGIEVIARPYGPRIGTYVSVEKQKSTNLKYFNTTEMEKELQDFIVNANEKNVDSDIWLKIKNGTLTERDLLNYIRDTDFVDMDVSTFNMISKYIYHNDYIETPKQLEYFVDNAPKFYALKQVLKSMKDNNLLKDELEEAIIHNRDDALIAKLINIVRGSEFLNKIYEISYKKFKTGFMEQIFSDLDKELFNKLATDKKHFGENNDRYLNVIDKFSSAGISEKYLRAMFLRKFDGTLKSAMDVTGIARWTAWHANIRITGEITKRSLGETEEGKDVLENIADPNDNFDDNSVFWNYVDEQDDVEMLDDMLDTLTLKYVYDLYNKYSADWNKIGGEKIMKNISQYQEKLVETLGKLINMDRATLEKNRQQLNMFIYNMGLQNLSAEDLEKLNKIGNKAEKSIAFKKILSFGERTLQTMYVDYMTQAFVGSNYIFTNSGLIETKRSQYNTYRKTKHILDTISANIKKKDYKKLVSYNDDILQLDSKGNLELKKDAYLNEDGTYKGEGALDALHARIKKLSNDIRKVGLNINMAKAYKKAYDEDIKKVLKDVKNELYYTQKENKKMSKLVYTQATENLKQGKKIQELQRTIFVLNNDKVYADGNVKMPDIVSKLLTKIYSDSDMSRVQMVPNADPEYLKASMSKVYEGNEEDLLGLTQNDVNDIIEFYMNSSVFTSQQSLRSYIVVQLGLLTYLIAASENGTGNFKISSDIRKQIENRLEEIASIGGLIGVSWREALKYMKGHTVQKIAASVSSKYGITYEGMEQDIDAIVAAVKSGSLERIKDAKQKYYENALKYVKGKKQSIFDKILRFERTAMLSGPGTWLRNISSNAVVTLTNKLGEVIGNIFPDRKNLSVQQYKLVGTKVSNSEDYNVVQWIEHAIKGNSFFDLLQEAFTKYDPRKVEFGSRANMLAQLIIDKAASDANIQGSTTTPGIKQYYAFVYKMLSDNAWIKRQFIKYLGKMITEDHPDLARTIRYDGQIEYTKEVSDIIANAYNLAMSDYMHKPNFITTLESQIKKKTGSAGFFVYKQIFPFLAPSLNWFMAGLKLSPVGLASAIVKYAKLEKVIQKAQDKAQAGEYTLSPRLMQYIVKRDLGKGILGTIGWVIGIALGATGVAKIDDEDGKFKLVIGDLHIDISALFGTQGILQGIVAAGMIRAGTKEGRSFWDILLSTTSTVLNQMFIDNSFVDVFNTFRYSDSFGDYVMTIPFNVMSMFIPNFIKQLGFVNKYTVNYEPGIVGKLERLAIQAIPGLSYALPHKIDVYTGEDQVQYKVWFLTQLINKYSPVKFQPYNISEAEKVAISLGITKNTLKGAYEINGEKVNVKNVELLNKFYGKLNKKSLNDFINDKVAYKVENEKGEYVTIKYSKMTDSQRKSVINRITSENANTAKIYILTSEGNYKYYASDVEYEKLREAGIKTNVYRKTDKSSGFVKR